MTDTFVAQSTPVGVSALALIRASGPLCVDIANELFEGSDEPQPRHAYFGRLLDVEGKLIDEVVWIFYSEESSYTGEPMLEIMPHGNPLICKIVIDDFCKRGCRLADPGEFTQRAYLNGKLNFSQVEGVLDVIHAQSDRALFYARKHLSGESGRAIKGMVREMTSIRAEIEAYIDFPEDELPPENSEGPLQKLKSIIETLDRFEATAKNRETIQNGLNTLIVGAPNAGKSSLLNALLGHNRALVSPTAGTTRDYILESTFVGSHLVNLFDTAGLSTTPSGELESEGIHRTLDLIDQAEFFLIVIDSAEDLPVLPEELTTKITSTNSVVVENKIDLPDSRSLEQFLPEIHHVRISTLERSTLIDLLTLWEALIDDELDIREEEGIMFNLRQAEFIRNSLNELKQAQQVLKELNATELAAFHLIRASEELVKINEHIDNDSVLDDLFSRFCIGK